MSETRNELLHEIGLKVGSSVPVEATRNALLAGIAGAIGGSSTEIDTRNAILSEILSLVGGTPSADDTRNGLLLKICAQLGATCDPTDDRNKLLQALADAIADFSLIYDFRQTNLSEAELDLISDSIRITTSRVSAVNVLQNDGDYLAFDGENPFSVGEGLFIEDQSTNLIPDTSFPGFVFGCTATALGTVANLPGIEVELDSSSGIHCAASGTLGTVALQAYTLSVRIDPNGNRYFLLSLNANNGTNYASVLFDLQTLSAIDTELDASGGFIDRSLIYKKGETYFLEITGGIDAANYGAAVCLSDSATPSYFFGAPVFTGSGEIFSYSVLQCEESNYSTSPILTSGSPVTRRNNA